MAQFNYESFVNRAANNNGSSDRPKIDFLGKYLKNDGDTVVVRFPYKSVNDFDFCSVHRVYDGGIYRSVSCLRNDYDAVAACPLCAAGETRLDKFYVKCILYSTDEKGNRTIIPCVWERPALFAKELAGYLADPDFGGDLTKIVFKVKRSGAAKSKNTTYSLVPCHTAIYNENSYPADFSAFNNFKVAGYAYKVKTYEELAKSATSKSEVQPTDNGAENIELVTYTRAYTEPQVQPQTVAPQPQVNPNSQTLGYGQMDYNYDAQQPNVPEFVEPAPTYTYTTRPQTSVQQPQQEEPVVRPRRTY